MENTSSNQAVDRAALAELLDVVSQVDRLLARAVILAGRVARSGVAEAVEGLPLEHLLGLAARMTGGDRRMLITAGEVLADLPTVARLFSAGEVGWGQVRAIVLAARRLSREDRATLDARIAETVAVYDGVDAFDPDQLVWAVDVTATDLADRRAVQRREQRRQAASFLAVQPRLDGGVTGHFDLDPLAGATMLNALDAAAATPAADETPAGEVGTSRGRQLADALVTVCGDWLGGGPGRRARPLHVVHVDVADATVNAAGIVEVNVRGALPTITRRMLARLAQDADVKLVVSDGARPLATSKKLSAKNIPADTAFAVKARDKGCRFPGSPDPIGHTDLHHLVERARGGTHHPDTLVALSRRHHRLVHLHGWRLHLHPRTGVLRATRGDRTWRSVPNGTRLRPASHAGDRAPPRHVDPPAAATTDPPRSGPPDPGDLPF